MSNIQLLITPKRDFAVFYPVLHIILLTAIEGGGWLAAWMGHHFTWEMMHVFTVGTMLFVLPSVVLLRFLHKSSIFYKGSLAHARLQYAIRRRLTPALWQEVDKQGFWAIQSGFMNASRSLIDYQ